MNRGLTSAEPQALPGLAKRIEAISLNMTSAAFLIAAAEMADGLDESERGAVQLEARLARRHKLCNAALFALCVAAAIALVLLPALGESNDRVGLAIQILLTFALLGLGTTYRHHKHLQSHHEGQIRARVYAAVDAASTGDLIASRAERLRKHQASAQWLRNFRKAVRNRSGWNYCYGATLPAGDGAHALQVFVALLDGLRKLYAFQWMAWGATGIGAASFLTGLALPFVSQGNQIIDVAASLVLGLALTAFSVAHEYRKKVDQFMEALERLLPLSSADKPDAVRQYFVALGSTDTGMTSLNPFSQD